MRIPRGEARSRILDAARVLYARDGVGATSIRGVVRASGTNLNAVHYHFGSRAGLVEELVDQALARLNEERFARLDSAADRGGSLRDVLDAGYGPLFRQALGRGWERTRPGLVIVGQLRFDPTGAGGEALARRSAEFVERIEASLRRLASVGPTELRLRMQLVNAAAWDSALRPDVQRRIETSERPTRALRRFVTTFLDFAEAGLDA